MTFAEGKKLGDFGMKSSISSRKIVFLKCKTAKNVACGGLKTLKTVSERATGEILWVISSTKNPPY